VADWDAVARGAVNIEVEAHLRQALASGRTLRVKLGIDPSSPDIHLGHTVVLGKLGDFQRLGHQAVLIIGDFTARIGDPSGQSATRRPLEVDEVEANAATYLEQVFKVLDPARTEVRRQSEWFGGMTLAEVLRLAGRVTLAQIATRDDFRKRIEAGTPVGLHELMYPLMQAYDSVAVKSDVELGGTDQLFNLMFGRDLQREHGQEPQDVITMPLLEGLDGVNKMSKSLGNYVGVSEDPFEMYGKLMSVPDELIIRWRPRSLSRPSRSSNGRCRLDRTPGMRSRYWPIPWFPVSTAPRWRRRRGNAGSFNSRPGRFPQTCQRCQPGFSLEP